MQSKKYKIPFVTTLHNYRLICPSAILYFNHKPFCNSLHEKFPWTAIRKGVYRNSVVLTFLLSISTQLHNWLGTWKYCNRFIVLSKDAKKIFRQSYINYNTNNIIIKPNFLACDFKNNVQKDDYFFYAGRLSEEKGINVLLNAFSQCDYKIKIAGKGDLEQKVIDYSNRFSNIEFVGNLQKQEVLDYMERSTALTFPSVWLEGMPLTIIEAFASGTPVIASRIGVMRHMITDKQDGIFFKSGKANDLLNKLHHWQSLSNDEKNVYNQNARTAYDKNYSPEINGRQLLSIYNDVIKTKPDLKPLKN